MRISLVVLDEDRSARGAALPAPTLSPWVTGLVTSLVREHDVTIITDLDRSSLPDLALRSRRWISGSLTVRDLPRRRAGDPLSASKVRGVARMIGEIDADVVHTVGVVAGRVVEAMGWDAAAPLVWSAGRRHESAERAPVLLDWTPSRAEAVIAATRHELDRHVALGVSPDRLSEVPLRVWPTAPPATDPVVRYGQVRRVLCLLDEDPAGTIAMVRALACLPHARCLVVSRRGADSSGRAAQAVAMLVHHLHLEERVTFLPGVTDLVLEQAMRQSDVVAILESGEPDLPAVGAALVSGAVALVRSGGGVEEVVEHGVSGVVLRTLDVRPLTTALRILDRDPGIRESMTVAARRRVREVYDPERLMAACLDVYEAACCVRNPVGTPSTGSLQDSVVSA